MALYQYSWAILFAPLLAFVVIIFGTRVWDLLSRPKEDVQAAEVHGDHDDAHGEDSQEFDDNPKVPALTLGARCSGYVAIVLMGLACIYSWVILVSTLINPQSLPVAGVPVFSYPWFMNYTVSFHIDHLAIAMMVVVTTVTTLVMIYSQGYMENSAGYSRFYSYLALFAFSMLVIVFAQNFLVIFIGWELVGLSSYLLIGFWINKQAKPAEQRPSPASASIQAFIMNRIGDVGFIIGIMILFVNTGTFEFDQLFKAAPSIDKTTLTIAMILIFCGAIGKSAQIPLQTWLPPAMEGPTPVSALIHAATMVAAGVYMVARTYPLFAASGSAALGVVAWIGTITALYAALVALVQSDFKRVLAFSTISQLGYMFVGLGVAGPLYGTGPGMFHLFTHAFFKALLFLCAGSVIEALHHATHKEVQDMRLMGGLGPKMPITAIAWLIATLAISGFPGFSGFFSKEFIIGQALQQGDVAIYILTLLTAGLTAFYMLRAFILAFGGKGGGFGGLWGGSYRGVGEPHESPFTMTLPLILLSVASIVAGYWLGFFSYLSPSNQNLPYDELLADPFTWVGVIVALVGFGVAYVLYARTELAQLHAYVEERAWLRIPHRILYNRFFVDTLYDWIVRYIVLGLAHFAAAFDQYVIDGLVNAVARGVTGLGSDVRRVETGRVQSYMIGFFGGVAILAVIVIALITIGGQR